MKPKFSICIPNYNYEHYIDLTLDSVNQQTFADFQVNISDNASTDKSLDVIKKHAAKDSRISYKVNSTNIGFAGNLDEAGRMANGEWMIMLSSDDVIKENALSEYNKFIKLIESSQKFAFCSTFEKIDSEGNFLEILGPNSLWQKSDLDNELSTEMNCKIYKVEAGEMLNRCLNQFLNPFNFASTCYANNIYEIVGGYGGGRVYNPDKWFHWKILSMLDYVYFIDIPLFKYRWHNSNQVALEKESNVLKYWYDEYRNSFEVDKPMLLKAKMNKNEVINSYCLHLLKYVFAAIMNQERKFAIRLLNWGRACYPVHFSKTKYNTLLSFLAIITPFSSFIIRLINNKLSIKFKIKN